MPNMCYLNKAGKNYYENFANIGIFLPISMAGIDPPEKKWMVFLKFPERNDVLNNLAGYVMVCSAPEPC